MISKQPDYIPGTARIEAFSDGVIAIIITIMVLELKLPPNAGHGDLFVDFLIPIAPKVAIYGWSFLVVAIMWVNHHSMLHQINRATGRIIWGNMNLLFWMSLIPLATGFWGEHPILPSAVAVYGLILTLTGGSFAFLRWIAANDRNNQETAGVHRDLIRKSLTGVAIYAVSVPLALVSVYLSMLCFLIVPAMFFRPTREDAC